MSALLVAGALAAGAPAPAEAVTIGPCRIEPTRPVKVSDTRARVGAVVGCTPVVPAFERYIDVRFWLYGDDAVHDDRMGHLRDGARVPPSQGIVTTRTIRCNEDIADRDELYAVLEARIQIEGLYKSFTAWSAQDRSRTVRGVDSG